jgi:hypothetical protein
VADPVLVTAGTGTLGAGVIVHGCELLAHLPALAVPAATSWRLAGAGAGCCPSASRALPSPATAAAITWPPATRWAGQAGVESGRRVLAQAQRSHGQTVE